MSASGDGAGVTVPDTAVDAAALPPLPVGAAQRLGRRGSFLEGARALETLDGPPVDEPWFYAHVPRHDAMSRAQLAWYVHWRGRFRAGVALETRPSYAMVHVFELLHLVGVADASAALRELVRVYAAYPALRRELWRWVLEFMVYHDLPPESRAAWILDPPPELHGDAAVRGLALRTWARTRDYAALPGWLLAYVCGYRHETSRFYAAHADHAALERAYRAALAAADHTHVAVHGRSILHLGAPRQRRWYRQAFVGVPYEGEPCRVELGHVLEFGALDTLRPVLTVVLRHAENVMRRHAGVRSRLQGVVLGEELARAIERALEPPPVRRVVEVDAAALQVLQAESEVLRAALLADLLEEEAPVSSTSVPSTSVPPTSVPPTSVPPTPALAPDTLELARRVIAAGGPCRLAELADLGRPVRVLADELNEWALDVLGDVCVEEVAGALELLDPGVLAAALEAS